MKNIYNLLAALVCVALSIGATAQCSTTAATTCLCEQPGQTNCDLLPDMTVSWYALENYASGPSEYSQSGNGVNDGRLRVTGSTPNIGHGALNVRGVDENGYRWFLCGTDTFNIYDPNNTQQFTCPNAAQTAQQLILQRVYQKNGSLMEYYERFAGTMTYHPSHGHNHVDDWATFTLRIEDPNEPNPLNWSIVGDGAKVGFCLMDFYSCNQSSGQNHCRTSQEYQGGLALNAAADFANYGHGGGSYGCSPISQGISVGYTDVYSESLDGMWVDVPPGTCNGNYWIVMQVDENDHFLEEDESNNWTAIPWTLTQQSSAGNFIADVATDGSTEFCSGGSVMLTSTAGDSYLWSTGETTQSIVVADDGNYSCTVTSSCGTGTSNDVVVNKLEAAAPITTGATLNAPGTAAISATGADIEWYDAEFGGNMVGTGNSLTTPSISQTTSYWAEARETVPGSIGYGARADNSGGGGNYNYDNWLEFDAYEAFVLKSVKLYVNAPGFRRILVTTAAGDAIGDIEVNLATGEQDVILNFNVPPGNGHQIHLGGTSTLGNTVLYDCYRNNAGANYPYNLNNLGQVTNASNGTTYYYFFYNWQVEKPDLTCMSPRSETVVTVDDVVKLELKAMLSGPLDIATGTMFDDLRTGGWIPLTEPYTAAGYAFVGGGGESIGVDVLTYSGLDAIVDWVVVELRDKNDPTIILTSRAALIQRDGDVVDLDGTSSLAMLMQSDDYHVALRHRNHLGVMTNQVYTLSGTATAIDFTNQATTTWGTNAQFNENGTMVMWNGDVNADAVVKYVGNANDRDLILLHIGGTVPTAISTGYHGSDINLDGVVKYTGAQNDRDKLLLSIGGTVPTTTVSEQLP